jgi:hypothetical protein
MKKLVQLFALAILLCIGQVMMAQMPGPSAPLWLRYTGISYDTATKIYSVQLEWEHGYHDNFVPKAVGFQVYRALVGTNLPDNKFDLVGSVSGDEAAKTTVSFTDANVPGGVYEYFVRGIGNGMIGQRSSKIMVIAPGSYCVNMSDPVLNFQSFPPTVAVPGQTYTYQAYAQHRSLRVQGWVRYQLIQAPEGMTIDEVKGIVTWPIPVDAKGVHIIKVRSWSLEDASAETFQEWSLRLGETFEVKALLSVKEDAVKNSVLSPNPASDLLTLQCESANSGMASITLTDMLGNPAFSTQYMLTQGTNTVQLPVSTISTGAYMLNVRNQAGLSVYPVQIIR